MSAVITVYVWYDSGGKDELHILRRTQGYRTFTLCGIDVGLTTRVYEPSPVFSMNCAECRLGDRADRLSADVGDR